MDSLMCTCSVGRYYDYIEVSSRYS